MNEIDDIVIVGAGPAGTSAALAFADAGRKVRLVDAGTSQVTLPPAGNFLALRSSDPLQRRWQVGEQFEGLRASSGNSPKLRVPGMQTVFAGYAEANRIYVDADFQLLGALCAGGLSNAWGCGVAAFDAKELAPLRGSELAAMADGYRRSALRMGLSGRSDDPLAELIGVDKWAGPALPLDRVHSHIFAKGSLSQSRTFRLGRARVAVLSARSEDPTRQACDLSGLCLWGCPNRSTWSAALDLHAVRRGGITIDSGVCVRNLVREGSNWRLDCTEGGHPRQYRATRIILAAGTIASTRLVLAALDSPPSEIRLQSNPMAAFLALVPRLLGHAYHPAFGLAQLSFATDCPGSQMAFGNLFSTAGLPVSEFLSYLPLSRRAGIPLLRSLLPACVVGNVFLPGSSSDHRVGLGPDAELRIRGGAVDALAQQLDAVRGGIARGLRSAGALMLPGSFVPGQPGADLHYASTLPMSSSPMAHETRIDGEVAGLPGLYVVDGAALPSLPAKAHTLSIMANADRISRALLSR